MFDTMTITKALGALCGAFLIFLMGSWAASALYDTKAGGGHGAGHGEEGTELTQAYTIEVAEAGTGDAAAAGPTFEEIFATADATKGEKVFGKCAACHKLDGSDGVGPHLNGVVDRAKAASAGFAYSDALKAMASDTWTPANLNAFLTNPKSYAKGTKMSFAGLPKAEDRANLIAWLATQQ
jgi:cytochrome c